MRGAICPDVGSWLNVASTDSGLLTGNPEIIHLGKKRAIRAYRFWGTFGEQLFPNKVISPRIRAHRPTQMIQSKQQGLGLFNLLNRCRGQNLYRGFESPPLRQFF